MADPAARILQICPNDHPPFLDICDVYAAAGASLGCQVDTVFLSATRAVPGAGMQRGAVRYLGADDESAARSTRAVLRDHIAAGPAPLLTLCHRYRAYRELRGTGLRLAPVVTVAHEFGFFKRAQRRLERRLFASRMLFAGVSPAVQAELAETVPGALCLPNGIDVEAARAAQLDRTAAQDALGVAEGPFTIGLLGRLVPKKRPDLAIGALKALLDQVPDARLLIIGDGELREGLGKAAADLPIRFCGFLPDARRLLAALDVLLLVSKDVEAFGMVALEAMAAGIPVVAGPSPGPRSVLGPVGFYYERAEAEDVAAALKRVHGAQTDARLEERLRQGVERARREFSIAAVARRLDELFIHSKAAG